MARPGRGLPELLIQPPCGVQPASRRAAAPGGGGFKKPAGRARPSSPREGPTVATDLLDGTSSQPALLQEEGCGGAGRTHVAKYEGAAECTPPRCLACQCHSVTTWSRRRSLPWMRNQGARRGLSPTSIPASQELGAGLGESEPVGGGLYLLVLVSRFVCGFSVDEEEESHGRPEGIGDLVRGCSRGPEGRNG